MFSGNAAFTLFYDGEALHSNLMDVRDLTPALLAFADMLEQANRTLNGNKAAVKVNVRVFEKGSFGISFEVVQSLTQAFQSLISPHGEIRNALEILALLGITPTAVGLGLFQLIKKMKGKNPKSTKRMESGNISISFEAEPGQIEEVEVTVETAGLLADKQMRVSIGKIMEPLKKTGVETLAVKQPDGAVIPLVNKKEAIYFEPPAMEPIPIDIDETPQETMFSIVSLSFKEDNKWKLSDGNNTFNVKISDKDFIDRVQRKNESFAKNDLLRVMLVKRQSTTSEGLKTEYEVVKVLEHKAAERQLFLPYV